MPDGLSTGAAARLLPLPRTGLPGWCDRYLSPAGELATGRIWLDTTLAHALPPTATALAAVTDAVLVPLLRQGRRLGSLTTDYSLLWQPLIAPGTDDAALRTAGRTLGRLLRFRPPLRLEAMDAEAPGLEPLLEGCRAAGLMALRYRHFGNWHEEFAEGLGWDAYLAARPPALRTTIGRKLARAGRELRFELLTAPGLALETGIAAYEAVRAGSWKPHEPFAGFDAALMRAMAAAGALRLGVLRNQQDGAPVAAQYWVVAGRRATIPKLYHLEAARAASPGTVLTALMIRRLLETDRVRSIDFGRGDDAYKQLWAGTRRQRIGVILLDPRHPEGLLALARDTAGRLRRRFRPAIESLA
ncbi:hypothetical protein GCM10011504_14590 [Siccirubricoccus deserti]|uniref:GNAT family N-acetyltransferase n=1 Tax=Siccirubricoccus deserti TaxID=2013562 RepID=A0A9X0UC73_9PROT|nr:GNAT family N-acetyltransferase [Siccirubricoccus deserti]MBC4014889.1 GNAT family N-acetyltransferase [Siccirubricoccus deserti]GGC37302.1 hypothetical protein GCM10011504_14590 [Siccirubricoccus deserti]